MRRNTHPIPDNSTFNWRTLFQLAPYLIEFKYRIFFAVLCLIITKIASVYLPFVLKYLVDSLNEQPSNDIILVPLGLVAAYGLVRFSSALFVEIRDTLFGRVTERVVRRVSLRVFSHLHSLDLAFHLNRQTGGLSRDIERGTSGISFLMRFMVFNIVPTLIEILMVVGILLFNYGLSFALVTLISIVIYIVFSVMTTNWRTKFIRAANSADSSSNTRAIDSLINFETVKYFTNEKYEAQCYDQQLIEWESAKNKNRLSLFTLNTGQALIISLSMTIMLALAANDVANKQITIGDFVLINAFMMQLFMPLNFLGFVYREIKASMVNIEQMLSLLSTSSSIKENPNLSPLIINKGVIEFKEVSFYYQKERPIIKKVSFSVAPRQKVAIVGASGSGKSTLVKLLFRFYDVSSGEITIDGQKITEVTLESLRKVIGIVPQDTVLFNDSIFENVRYGRPQASDDEVKRAISLAHLDTFIEALPDGYQTKVGERGLKLSGGEKQRIAIARTILKEPAILVFDEATSSLDSHSEQAILAAIKEVSAQHTSLVIAHRLSTIVDANIIIVLNVGQIVEQGDHNALIKQNGPYAKLWQAQQSNN